MFFPPPLRVMLAVVLAGVAGCGRPEDAGSAAPSAAAPSAAAPPAAVADAPPAAPADADAPAAVLAELTQAVRRFGAEQRRVPQGLEELVQHGYLGRMPPAPAGRRFAITRDLRVVLE